jgi:hypothetical protein
MADVIVHIKDGKIDQYLENTEKVSAADLAL